MCGADPLIIDVFVERSGKKDEEENRSARVLLRLVPTAEFVAPHQSVLSLS